MKLGRKRKSTDQPGDLGTTIHTLENFAVPQVDIDAQMMRISKKRRSFVVRRLLGIRWFPARVKSFVLELPIDLVVVCTLEEVLELHAF